MIAEVFRDVWRSLGQTLEAATSLRASRSAPGNMHNKLEDTLS
jgi:hypothetical protein